MVERTRPVRADATLAAELQAETALRTNGDVGPAVSPSGRYIAILASPRSLLVVELAGDAGQGRDAVGSQPCALGARVSISCESDVAAFGWCRRCDEDILADCGGSCGGLRVWQVGVGPAAGTVPMPTRHCRDGRVSTPAANGEPELQLAISSLGGCSHGVAGAREASATSTQSLPRALCWHPAGKKVVCVSTTKGLHVWRAPSASAVPLSSVGETSEGAGHDWEHVPVVSDASTPAASGEDEFSYVCEFGGSKLTGALAWGQLPAGRGPPARGNSDAADETSTVMYVTGERGVHTFVLGEAPHYLRLSLHQVVSVGKCPGSAAEGRSGGDSAARGVLAMSGGVAVVSVDGRILMRRPAVGPPLLTPAAGARDGDGDGLEVTNILESLLGGGGGVGGSGSKAGASRALISVVEPGAPDHLGAVQDGAGGVAVAADPGAVARPAQLSHEHPISARTPRDDEMGGCARLLVLLLRPARVPAGGAWEVRVVGQMGLEGVMVADVLAHLAQPPPPGGQGGEGHRECVVVGASAQARRE